MSNNEHTADGVTRRQAMKRAGVAGAAVVWAAPVVQTINMSSAAAASATGDIKDLGGPKLTSIELRYLGGGTPHGAVDPCSGVGDSNGTPSDPVTVYATWGTPAGCNRLPSGFDCSPDGATGTPEATVPGVTVGNVLRFPATGTTPLNPDICLLAVDGSGTCTLTRIHTSCSAPISVGDICGQWQVVSATT